MRASLALFAISTLALSATACAGGHSGTGNAGLDAESSALVSDNTETDDTEDTVEKGLEDPLSGAPEGGEVDVHADANTVAESARVNPGLLFQPGACVMSTRSGNIVWHVFDDCSGPKGLVHFTGTVTSTWTKLPDGVQVTHETKSFKLNGAVISHTVTISYTLVNGIYTKTRSSSLTGTTGNGKPISHIANYVTTWDPATKCMTRNGSSDTTIGAREFTRTITDFERCADTLDACPKSGTMTLTRPHLNLTLSFPGGPSVDVTINGRTIERELSCSESSS